MTQYKYFHTSRGYVGRLSIGKDNRDYLFLDGAFDKLRAISEGNTFVYAILASGSSILMQSGVNDGGAFAHGLHITELENFPCQYIDALDRDIDNPDSVGPQLPEAVLPAPLAAPTLPADSRIYPFIPKLVEALVNGTAQKRILIHTDNLVEAQEFIGILSAILPHSFMMKTGFSIGSKSVNSTDIKIQRQSGSPDTMFIKLWIPKLMNYRFENYSSGNYVFDVESSRDNYTAPLTSFGTLLEKIDIRDKRAVAGLMQSINGDGGVFKADGSVDTKRLEIRAANMLLKIQNDPAVARGLLKSVDCSDAEERSTAATAIGIIVGSPDLGAQDLESIISLCTKSVELRKEKIAGENKNVYICLIETIAKYSLFDKISPEHQKQATELIGADALAYLYKGWSATCDPKDTSKMNRKLYDMTFGLIESKAGKDDESAKLLKKIALEHFGVYAHSSVSKSCIKGILDTLFESKEDKNRDEIIAILLAAVAKDGTEQMLNDRIELVREKMQKNTGREHLAFIVSLKKKLQALSKEFPGVVIYNAESFPDCCSKGEAWCNSIIGLSDVKGDMKAPLSDSIEDLIKICTTARDIKPLYNSAFKKLIETKYIREKIKKYSDPGYEIYKNFIKDLINQLNSQYDKTVAQETEEDILKDAPKAEEPVAEPATEPAAEPAPAEQSEPKPAIGSVRVDDRRMADRGRADAGRAKPTAKPVRPTEKKPAAPKAKFNPERYIPALSLAVSRSEKVDPNLIKKISAIRIILIGIEQKKRSKKFGMVAKLCRATDLYYGFKDEAKAAVRRLSSLDENGVEKIFCLDKKQQKDFVKATKEVAKRLLAGHNGGKKAPQQKSKKTR